MRFYCSRCGRPTELAADQNFGFCRFCGETIGVAETELDFPYNDPDKFGPTVTEAVHEERPADDYQNGVRRMWFHVWSMLLPILVMAFCILPLFVFGDFAGRLSDSYKEWSADGHPLDFLWILVDICALLGFLVLPYMLSVRVTANRIRIRKGWLIPKIVGQLISIVLYMILGFIAFLIYMFATQEFMPWIVNQILCVLILLSVIFFTLVFPFIQFKKSKITAAFMNETRYQREKIIEMNNAVHVEDMKTSAKMAGRMISWPIRAIFGAFLEGLSEPHETYDAPQAPQEKSVNEKILEEDYDFLEEARSRGEFV